MSGVKTIAAGTNHTVVIKNDETIWAWGMNSSGQLGDGTTTQRTTPVQVLGFTGATVIGVGSYHTVALKTDGTVWSWGFNNTGQL